MMILSIILLLGGCANGYQPSMRTPEKRTVYIKPWKSYRGFFDYEVCDIYWLDDRLASLRLTSTLKVTPEPHELGVGVEFRDKTTLRKKNAFIKLPINLPPGTYQLKQAKKGDQVQVWIEDTLGRRMSTIASGPWELEGIVIVIPSR